jgi:hypothetical protein
MAIQFILDYEREPDTNWTMRLHGEVEAQTLEDALTQTSASLGTHVWAQVSGNDMHGWDIAIRHADGSQDSITGCGDCCGAGCELCGHRGYHIEGE